MTLPKESDIPPPFNGSCVMSPASDRAKIFVGIFSKISNLGDSGISLFAFSSRTKMKLHNIP